MSQLTLYNYNVMQKKRNLYLDDLSFWSSGTNVVYDNNEVQYVRLDERIFIKISESQSNQAELANYARLIQDGKEWYFFVDSIEWRAKSTLEITLIMDVLNSWRRNEYIFDATTHIKRQHKNRWRKNGTKLIPIIDRYSEDINPLLITRTRTDIVDSCSWDDRDFMYYAVFGGSVVDRKVGEVTYKDTNIRAYMYREHNEISASTHNIKIGNDSAATKSIKVNVEGVTVDVFGQCNSTALIAACPYKPFTVLSRSGYSLIEDHRFEVLDKTTDSYLQIIKASDYVLAYNIIDGNFTVNPRLTGMRNSNLSPVTLDDYLVTHTPSRNDIKNIDYESKLLNSEFSFHRFVYGTDEFDLRYEYFHDPSNVSVNPRVAVTFVLTADLSGDMFFTFNISQAYDDETDDNEQYLVITRSNNKTILSYDYTNYLNVESQFDQKELALSRVNTALNLAGSAGSMILSWASGNAAVGVGGTMNAVSSVSGSILSRIQQETAYEKKIAMLKASKVTATASSGYEPFNLTWGKDSNGGKLKYTTGAPRDEVRNTIYNYLFRFGYSDNKYGAPNLDSRYWFNYIECEPVLRSGKIPAKYLRIIEERYREGVTIMHYHNEYDWAFAHENWEVSLLS